MPLAAALYPCAARAVHGTASAAPRPAASRLGLELALARENSAAAGVGATGSWSAVFSSAAWLNLLPRARAGSIPASLFTSSSLDPTELRLARLAEDAFEHRHGPARLGRS